MESNGYSCTRSEVGPYKLFSNIVVNIEKSDVVVAILTDFNSNVWYELGIRHTLKTGTIMLLQDNQSPPPCLSKAPPDAHRGQSGTVRSVLCPFRF